MKKMIGEVGSLRWLANMFPFTKNAKDETDKISNAIHVYCTAGADKIEELSDMINVLMKENEALKEKLSNNGVIIKND